MNKLTLSDLKALKEKAGQAFLSLEAIKGGSVADCHIDAPKPPVTQCDNV
ncbi:hypothetical protein L0657_17215 [Dyadobacter sp. CY345]|nr:hypothetical protein [Dyadobacter sp. CY345]MCF2445704.1 hypothetical protein [Dyadobacter sp. CY345]